MTRRKVIFPPTDYWTQPKDNTMTNDQPAPVNRPLTDDERHLINHLLVWKVRRNIALQGVSVTVESTVDALDDLNERTPLHREYDTRIVHVHDGKANHVLLTVTREWLAFNAQYGEQLTDTDLLRAMNEGHIA